MATYITIPKVPEERWLAQVTMVDAAVGDSNIVDLVVHGNNDTWSTNPHRRVVIDTGISYIKQPKSQITAAILDVLQHRSLPVYADAFGKIPRPAQPVPLPIHEVQITHADIDHIGNAGELMTELVTRGMLGTVAGTMTVPTTLRYSYVPPASPTLTTSLASAVLDPSDGTFFNMSWKVGGLCQWETELRGLGLSPWWTSGVVKLGNTTYYVKDEDMVKDEDVQEWFLLLKAPLTYLNDNTLQRISIGFELLVRESLSVNEDTDFFAGQCDFEYDINLILQWLRCLLEPSTYPKPNGGLPFTKAVPDFKTTHTALARLTPFRSSFPDVIRWVQPKDAQEEMRHRQQGVDEPHTATADLVQMIVSPTEQTYKALARYEVTGFLQKKLKLHELDYEEIFDDDMRGVYADESIANKASVITWFRREEFDFDMLFTGDAYDQEADIRDALTRIKFGNPPILKFSVLKVPHHGSNTTTHSSFYQQVRADVYLICGKYTTHGNPRFSSLRAIIEGFRGISRASGQPYRLYFSDPDCHKDSPTSKTWKHSPVKKILQMEYLRPNGHDLNYEMYRLGDLPTPKPNPPRTSYGSILFYIDESGRVCDYPHPDEWTLCHL